MTDGPVTCVDYLVKFTDKFGTAREDTISLNTHRFPRTEKENVAKAIQIYIDEIYSAFTPLILGEFARQGKGYLSRGRLEEQPLE